MASNFHRRELLTGRLPPTPPSEADHALPSREAYQIHYSRRAMACDFSVFVNAGQHGEAADGALAALDLVDQLEDQLTVYRPTSEVSQINRVAAGRAVVVEPQLFALLKQSLELHRGTAGAFDIATGSLTKTWGFYRRQGAIPTEEDLATALEASGSSLIELNPQQRTIRFSRPGVELNLGSIGKGYALDRAAATLFRHGVDNFLFHGGRSSVLAFGSAATSGPSGGWLIGIGDPLRPGRRLGQIRLKDRALATSGSGTQFFRHEGKRYGHILDPRTGRPAEGVLSATVVAPSAAEADALATACYVLGPAAAWDYCHAHPEIGLVLTSPGAGPGGMQLQVANLAEDWLPASPAN